jgi:Domain of unknown function (DUF4386)
MKESSQRAYARFAGLMYLLVDALDIGGVVILAKVSGSGGFVAIAHNISASETLYRIGICCGLAGILSTLLLAAGLYVTVKPVDANLAIAALLFRLVEVAIAGLAIVLAFATLQIYLDANRTSAFDTNQLAVLADLSSLLSLAPTGIATVVSVIFFSVGSAIFFYLFFRSAYIPRMLAAWGIFASLFCLVMFVASLVVAQDSGQLLGIGGLPIGIAEIVTGLWLLIRGIKTQPVRLQ